MIEFFVGAGLAAAAGLNAWMPLLTLGLAARFFDAVQLPQAWSWLSSDLALWIIGILLVLELVADKIPVVDTVNDAIQTVIRPASGGIVFGAGAASETIRVDDPATFFENVNWVPIAFGVVIALAVHIFKATFRPFANAATGGVAAPVVSTAEDATSLGLSIFAIVLPIVGIILLVGAIVTAAILIPRVKRQRDARAAIRAANASQSSST
ncbi:DUF4126 domain-containing protein [Microbacterium sediminicola]|uniref:DUF4126 domain-containing protein n=1 Tax=Microbacterium sediminicola TaxID=415210 RepID=A0ABN2HWG1_9MICO